MENHEQICKIISKVLKVPEADLLPETHFRSLPNADSMHVLQIILETENVFDIEIEGDATFRIDTIGDFEALVDDLCKQPISL